jgi:hypothetical protein
MAEKAIEELYNAGVSSDRISYSGRENTSSNFVNSLKSLFGVSTGSPRSSEVVNDLTKLGLGQDEAQYYAQEYEAGHTIIAVQPGDQTDNTMTILRSNGAHDFNSRANYDKVSGYAKSPYDTDTATTRADAMAQRTDDSPTNVPPATSTSFNQPTSAYEQSPATGSAPGSAYDQGVESTYGQNAAVGDQTSGTYEQGTTDTFQQQKNYNRDANIGTPPSSYSQGATYPGSAGSMQQPGYGNAPLKDQPTSAYNQPANAGQSTSYQQQQGFTQAPGTQDYTSSGSYGQQDINAQNQPGYGQQDFGSQSQSGYGQSDINAQNQPDYGWQSTNSQSQPAYDQPMNNPSMSNQPYSQDPTDPNAYRDPNASQYNRDTDTETRDQTGDTGNPFKKIVRHMKGEHDPDADYDREQRYTDPDQNY